MGEPAISPQKAVEGLVEKLLHAFIKKDDNALKMACFAGWHRALQAIQIIDTGHALQGSERLVEFLSQELVDDVHRTESTQEFLPYYDTVVETVDKKVVETVDSAYGA